ncbi:MAG: cobyrinate a,c-diamide synthase [Deltaproteobacteria bacterium]|nr:cobyrinate a,c-diamide synthase [Deltaproteobacteria bacterium]
MQQKDSPSSGIVVAALRGGSGKTLISIGIIAALKEHGKRVAPFKKGPDYIDAGWLALAAGRPCYNLDTFLITKETTLKTYHYYTLNTEIAIVEGNRGIYDGIDPEGKTSTAELAKLLNIPVILCLDCTKSTRTMAAAILGCIKFDPHTMIKGVILNNIAGKRHEKNLRDSIERYCGIPVLGALPKLGRQYFPERHMGLVPTPEHAWAMVAIGNAAKTAKKYIDLKTLFDIAHQSTPAACTTPFEYRLLSDTISPRPKIGIFRDAAFQFYYPENIESLKQAGAEIIFISPLEDKSMPEIDALYLGGGFPETHAEKLAQHVEFRNELHSRAEDGLPIYAECGGLMYLGKELVLGENSYAMTGILPIVFGFSKKPQGHGYTIINVKEKNPFFKIGTTLRGHEFHYSKVLRWNGDYATLAFKMEKGTGFLNKMDGICYKNILASYTHLHALGVPAWAEAMVNNAVSYRKYKSGKKTGQS